MQMHACLCLSLSLWLARLAGRPVWCRLFLLPLVWSGWWVHCLGGGCAWRFGLAEVPTYLAYLPMYLG
jgi:hypothetical protein